MAKGLLGGMTDYNHQSFTDIVHDLQSEEENVTAFIKKIEENIKAVNDNGFWNNNVISNFKLKVAYSINHFKTAQQELTEIPDEIQIEVKEHHCKRLIKLSEVAQEINDDIGRIWHQDYEEHGVKNYNDPNFRIVEDIYTDTRDMAVNLLDLSNIAERLKDFNGRQNPKVKKNFKLELSHKIALIALGAAIIVLLFGNNIIGRWLNIEATTTSIKTDSLEGKVEKDYKGNYIKNDTSFDKLVITKMKPEMPCSNDSIKFIPLNDNESIKAIYHGISIKFKKVIGNQSTFPSSIQPYYISDPLPYSLMIDYCSQKPCSSPVPNHNTLKDGVINSICVDDAQGIASMLCMQIPTNDLLINADAAGVITIDYQHLEIYASPTGEELFSMVKDDSLPNFSFTTAFDSTRRQYRFPGMEPDFKCAKGRFRLIKIIK